MSVAPSVRIRRRARKLYDAGKSFEAVARLLRRHPKTVARWLKADGGPLHLDRRSSSIRRAEVVRESPEQTLETPEGRKLAAELYRSATAGLGVDAIAKRFHATSVSVREALVSEGVAIRPRGTPKGSFKPATLAKASGVLARRAAGWRWREIGEALAMSKQAAQFLAKAYGTRLPAPTPDEVAAVGKPNRRQKSRRKSSPPGEIGHLSPSFRPETSQNANL